MVPLRAGEANSRHGLKPRGNACVLEVTKDQADLVTPGGPRSGSSNLSGEILADFSAH